MRCLQTRKTGGHIFAAAFVVSQFSFCAFGFPFISSGNIIRLFFLFLATLSAGGYGLPPKKEIQQASRGIYHLLLSYLTTFKLYYAFYSLSREITCLTFLLLTFPLSPQITHLAFPFCKLWFCSSLYIATVPILKKKKL